MSADYSRHGSWLEPIEALSRSHRSAISRSSRWTVIRAAVALALSASVYAQSPGGTTSSASDDGELTTVVVTARRVEERAQDVPISMTVFNQTQLNDRNVVSASDLALYTPSLAADNSFGAEATAFSIRGFVQAYQTVPSVAVYFADAVVPRGGDTGEAAGSGAGPGSFFDLENVQVLKGPQGTLFGRNTTGGAVLLVPKKPTDQFDGYIEGSYGNFDMGRVQAVVNVPINDSLRVRLGVDHEDREGYLENTSGAGPNDFNNIGYTSVRLSVVADITPELENYAVATYALSINNGPMPQLFTCHPGVQLGILCPSQFGLPLGSSGPFVQPGPYTVQNDLPGAESYLRSLQFIDTLTWHATDNLTVKNIVNYGQLKTLLDSDLFGSNFNLDGTPFFSAVSYPSGLGPGGNITDQYTFSDELQFSGRQLDNQFSWQAGGYLERSGPLGGLTGTRSPGFIHCTSIVSLQCTDVLGQLEGASVGTVQNDVETAFYGNLAAFAQGSYDLTQQLTLTAGIRYTSDTSVGTGYSTVYQFPHPNEAVPSFCLVESASLANNCYSVFRQDSSAPTGTIGLDYKAVEDVMLFAKYSRGYRQGSVDMAAPEYNTFKPEHVNDYEIGEKTSFRGAVSGTFNVTAFYDDFRNQQIQAGFVSETTGAANAAIFNGEKSRIYGLELDTTISPMRSLILGLSYGYLDTKLLELSVPTSPGYEVLSTAVSGSPLQYSPKHKGSASVTYILPVPTMYGSVTWNAIYSYTYETFVSAITPYGTLPGYGLLNMNLAWRTIFGHPVDAELFGTNLTNKLYFNNVTNYYNAVGFEDHFLGEPRTYGARVRIHFGKS